MVMIDMFTMKKTYQYRLKMTSIAKLFSMLQLLFNAVQMSR
jgi:hypothetical protein